MEKGGGGDEGWVRGSFPCSHSAGVSHLTRTFERAAAKKRLRLSLTAEPAQPGSLRTTSRSPSPCRRGGNPEIVPSPGAVPGAQAEPAARRGAPLTAASGRRPARPCPPRARALRAAPGAGTGTGAAPAGARWKAVTRTPGRRSLLSPLSRGWGTACYRRCRGRAAPKTVAGVEERRDKKRTACPESVRLPLPSCEWRVSVAIDRYSSAVHTIKTRKVG